VNSRTRKPPAEFGGEGREIIGDPTGTRGDGYLLYQNGSLITAHSASPRFEDLPPSKKPKSTPAKEAAWFNLSQRRRKSSEAGDIDQSGKERREATARRLGGAFEKAMLEGKLIALLSAVLKAHKEENDTQKKRKARSSPVDGFKAALWAVAWKSSHPKQITASSVMDHLDTHPKFCQTYGINQSMLSAREVKKWLESIGFGGLAPGRTSGQKRRVKRHTPPT
jgi:hypothetical protein